MAATVTNLTANGSTSNPGTTASVAPAASRVLLVEVAVTKTGSPAPGPGTVAVSGLGLTWAAVQPPGGGVLEQEYRSRRRLFWFVAETGGSAPTPGALTITYSGAATFQEVAWSVEELAGVVLGNGGQDAIGNVGNIAVGTGSTSISVTVTDTPVEGDISMGVAGIEEGGGTPGASSPATAVELSNVEHTNVRHLIVASDPDATMAFTFGPWGSTSNGAGAMAIRVVADAGGTIPEVTASIPLTVAVAGEAAVGHAVTASIPLAVAAAGTSAADHDATTSVPLAVTVAATAEAPGVAAVTASIPLGLSLAGSAQADRLAAAPVGLSVQLTAGAVAEHAVATAFPLGIATAGVVAAGHAATATVPLTLGLAATVLTQDPNRPGTAQEVAPRTPAAAAVPPLVPTSGGVA